jgi:hypothetical protein
MGQVIDEVQPVLSVLAHVPEGQEEHDSWLIDEVKVEPVQGRHWSDIGVVPYVPGGQSTQMVPPASVLPPPGHEAHEDGPFPACPAGHEGHVPLAYELVGPVMVPLSMYVPRAAPEKMV